jgi:hypothetical protein
MSTKNIVSTQKLASGKSLVTFRVDDDADGKPRFRSYSYSARAGAAIAGGRDPQKAKFVAHEVKVKENR